MPPRTLKKQRARRDMKRARGERFVARKKTEAAAAAAAISSHLQLDLSDGVERDPAGLCAGLAEGLVPHEGPSVVGHEADDAARRLLGAAAVVFKDLEAVRQHDLRATGGDVCHTRTQTRRSAGTDSGNIEVEIEIEAKRWVSIKEQR